MKLWNLIQLLFSLGLYAAPMQAAELDLAKTIESIRQVENTQIRRIGAAGEYGEWQITRAVWNAYSTKPFYWARTDDPLCRHETLRVVYSHVRWIISRLERLEMPSTPYSVALVWNAGYLRVLNNQSTWNQKDYARRVQNIYNGL